MASKTTNVKPVVISLWKLLSKSELIHPLKAWSISYCLRRYLWQVLPGSVMFLKAGYRSTWTVSMQQCLVLWTYHQIKGRLTIQCDEVWSFVNDKSNKQWIWLALDVITREIVGVYVGARSQQGARQLWNSLPGVYRQCAVAYMDFWDAYGCVFPKQRHQAVGKEQAKPPILNASTAPCVSECLG